MLYGKVEFPKLPGGTWETQRNSSTILVQQSILKIQKDFLHCAFGTRRCRLPLKVQGSGRTSDVGVFASSDLERGMENNTLHVPCSTSLPGASHLEDVPYVVVSDRPLSLKPYLMRPYPGQNLIHKKRIFNYRLSSTRMVVGITLEDFPLQD